MKSNYKKLGAYVRTVDERNTKGTLGADNLYGLSVTKEFINTHANLVGVTFDSYKVVGTRQFAYIPDTSRRGDKIAIALNTIGENIIVSSICTVFEIVDERQLLPEYLMLWFMRPEFDRYARFMSNGSAREVFDWESMCGVELPVPPIDEQRKIVHDYQVITYRIQLLRKQNETYVEAIKQMYRHSFWAFDYPLTPMADICSKIGSGATPRGGKESYSDTGISLIRSTNVYDYHFSYSELAHITNEQAEALSNVAVESFDVLFNITGVSIARCCIVPADVLPARVNQHVMIMRPKDGTYMSLYLMFTLCNQAYKNLLIGIGQSGSTRDAINKQEMEEFRIPLPPRRDIMKFSTEAGALYESMQRNTQETSLLQGLQKLILAQISSAR